MQPETNYYFLDGDAERQQLIREIVAVRDEVINLISNMPEETWYEARYHGWTPAAMLAHLNLVDAESLLMVKAALIGIRPKVGMGTVNGINNFTSNLFRKRVVTTTISGIRNKQNHLSDFILKLPISKFSTQVYDPREGKYITVEHALQSFFVHHWRNHLQDMREVEGISHPPEERSDSI